MQTSISLKWKPNLPHVHQEGFTCMPKGRKHITYVDFELLLHILSRMCDNMKWATSWQNQQNDCAPSEDSDQPGHPPSLIKVFTVCMKKLGSLATHWAHSEDSDKTGQMPRSILSLRWAHSHFVGFVMKWLSSLLLLLIYFFGDGDSFQAHH